METKSAVFISLNLLFSCLAFAASNPDDPGTPGHARRWYVDSKSKCSGASCGSQKSPFQRLQEGVARLQPGDELIIAGHDDAPYEEWLNLPKLDRAPNDTPYTMIRGWRGMPKPIIRGSVAYSGWQLTKYPNTYFLSWDYTPPDQPNAILEPQQVFRGGKALQQVGGRVFGGYPKVKHPALTNEEIWPGRLTDRHPSDLDVNQFMFDRNDGVLYVRLSTPLKSSADGKISETLDVSIRHFLAVNNASYKVNNLTLQDLVFERTSTSYYWRGGGIMLAGNNITLNKIVAQDMDSFCIQLTGDNNTVRDSLIQRCGQLGLAAGGKNLHIHGNQFLHNNTRRFNPYWEAGAMKFVSTPPISGARITENVVANTILGDGIWLDTYQDDNAISGNKIAYNNGIGIHIELSNKAHISDNIIVGNTAQGIQMVDSSGSVITGNLIAGNVQDGILIQSDARVNSNPSYRSVGNIISKNKIAWNWEISGEKNFRALAIPSDTQASNNQYCGTSAGTQKSIHFLADKTLHNWSTWGKTGIEKNSIHNTGSLPAELRDRLLKRDITLVATSAAITSYITAYCHNSN